MILSPPVTARLSWTGILIIALLLNGCSPFSGPIATPIPPAAATPVPTPSPTPAPLGGTDNPLVFGLVSTDQDPEAIAAARELALRLTVQTGYAIQSKVLPSYNEVVDDLSQGTLHLAWLPPLTYLYAQRQNFADAALLTNHYGTYSYGTQYLTNVENGYATYFDPETGENTGDASTALAQLDGATPCWVERDSAGGYILPAGILSELGINIQPGVLAQDSAAIVRALYVKGICQFGATFSESGDPRTSFSLDDLPDAQQRVVVLWRSDPLIPNLNLSFLPNLPDTVRENLTITLLNLAKSEDGKDLLTRATAYDIQDLREVDDSFYDPLRGAVQRTQTDLTQTIGK